MVQGRCYKKSEVLGKDKHHWAHREHDSYNWELRGFGRNFIRSEWFAPAILGGGQQLHQKEGGEIIDPSEAGWTEGVGSLGLKTVEKYSMEWMILEWINK